MVGGGCTEVETRLHVPRNVNEFEPVSAQDVLVFLGGLGHAAGSYQGRRDVPSKAATSDFLEGIAPRRRQPV